MSQHLILAARLLGLFSILFVSSFALDVFSSGAAVPDLIVGLVVHLMPSFILVAILTIAWNLPFAGGMIFVLIAMVPFVTLPNSFATNAMLAAPFLLTGALFIAGALTKR